MNQKDIRWRQRYQNLSKAFHQFQDAILNFEQLTTLEKEGLIQRFEYTFELSWKTLKDYLEAQGVEASFPREVIKSAFHYGMIEEGEVWMDMLEKRSLMAHTYDESRFNHALEKINGEYSQAIKQIYEELSSKC